MAKEKETTAFIQLKKSYKNPVEIAVGSDSISAVPGKPIELGEKEAFRWLATGKFDRVDTPAKEATPLELLKKKGKEELVKIATEMGIETGSLKKDEIAELIVRATEEKN